MVNRIVSGTVGLAKFRKIESNHFKDGVIQPIKISTDLNCTKELFVKNIDGVEAEAGEQPDETIGFYSFDLEDPDKSLTIQGHSKMHSNLAVTNNLTIGSPNNPIFKAQHNITHYDSSIIKEVTMDKLVEGKIYKINTTDTGFTSVGAANNNVGTVFKATGAGSGSGTALECRHRILIGKTEEDDTEARCILDLNDVPTEKNSSLLMPVGLTSERPQDSELNNGMIRFNTTNKVYEGFSSPTLNNNGSWSSLGSVMDIDGDTKISQEINYTIRDDRLSGLITSTSSDFNKRSYFVGGDSSNIVTREYIQSGVLWNKSNWNIKNISKSENVTFDNTDISLSTVDNGVNKAIIEYNFITGRKIRGFNNYTNDSSDCDSFIVDFHNMNSISQIYLISSGTNEPSDFKLQYSSDGSHWKNHLVKEGLVFDSNICIIDTDLRKHYDNYRVVLTSSDNVINLKNIIFCPSKISIDDSDVSLVNLLDKHLHNDNTQVLNVNNYFDNSTYNSIAEDYTFNGNNRITIDSNVRPSLYLNDFSISIHFKLNELVNNGEIISDFDGTNNNSFRIFVGSEKLNDDNNNPKFGHITLQLSDSNINLHKNCTAVTGTVGDNNQLQCVTPLYDVDVDGNRTPKDKYYRVTFVKEATNIKVYLDGNLDGEFTLNSFDNDKLYNSTNPILLGNNNKCKLKLLKIYNSPLTSSDVSTDDITTNMILRLTDTLTTFLYSPPSTDISLPSDKKLTYIFSQNYKVNFVKLFYKSGDVNSVTIKKSSNNTNYQLVSTSNDLSTTSEVKIIVNDVYSTSLEFSFTSDETNIELYNIEINVDFFVDDDSIRFYTGDGYQILGDGTHSFYTDSHESLQRFKYNHSKQVIKVSNNGVIIDQSYKLNDNLTANSDYTDYNTTMYTINGVDDYTKAPTLLNDNNFHKDLLTIKGNMSISSSTNNYNHIRDIIEIDNIQNDSGRLKITTKSNHNLNNGDIVNLSNIKGTGDVLNLNYTNHQTIDTATGKFKKYVVENIDNTSLYLLFNNEKLATEIQNTKEYTISQSGNTDFMYLGASDNNVGTIFIANSNIPQGTGKVTTNEDIVISTFTYTGSGIITSLNKSVNTLGEINVKGNIQLCGNNTRSQVLYLTDNNNIQVGNTDIKKVVIDCNEDTNNNINIGQSTDTSSSNKITLHIRPKIDSNININNNNNNTLNIGNSHIEQVSNDLTFNIDKNDSSNKDLIFEQKENYSLYFDGSSNLKLTNSTVDGTTDSTRRSIIPNLKSGTIEFYFKRNRIINEKEVIYNDSSTEIYINNNELIVLNNSKFVSSIRNIDDKIWNHIAYTFTKYSTSTNKDKCERKLYLNGTLIDQLIEENNSTLNTSNNNIYLGSDSTPQYHFNGYIFDFRLWDVVRTSTEINNNMNKYISTESSNILINLCVREHIGLILNNYIVISDSIGTQTAVFGTNATARTYINVNTTTDSVDGSGATATFTIETDGTVSSLKLNNGINYNYGDTITISKLYVNGATNDYDITLEESNGNSILSTENDKINDISMNIETLRNNNNHFDNVSVTSSTDKPNDFKIKTEYNTTTNLIFNTTGTTDTTGKNKLQSFDNIELNANAGSIQLDSNNNDITVRTGSLNLNNNNNTNFESTNNVHIINDASYQTLNNKYLSFTKNNETNMRIGYETFDAGERFQSFYLTGTDSKIISTSGNALPLQNDYCIQFWFKKETTDANEVLLTLNNSSNEVGKFEIDANNNIKYTCGTTSILSSVEVNDTNWHNVCVSFTKNTTTGIKGSVDLIIDGILDKSEDNYLDNYSNDVNEIILGQDTSDGLNGYLTDIRIFIKYQSVENILSNLYNPNYDDNLILHIFPRIDYHVSNSKYYYNISGNNEGLLYNSDTAYNGFTIDNSGETTTTDYSYLRYNLPNNPLNNFPNIANSSYTIEMNISQQVDIPTTSHYGYEVGTIFSYGEQTNDKGMKLEILPNNGLKWSFYHTNGFTKFVETNGGVIGHNHGSGYAVDDEIELTDPGHSANTITVTVDSINITDSITDADGNIKYTGSIKTIKTPVQNHENVNAGSFIVGTTYKIKTPGTTDFISIGASNDNSDTEFTATDVGVGNGIATEVWKSDVEYTRVTGTSNSSGTGAEFYLVFDGSGNVTVHLDKVENSHIALVGTNTEKQIFVNGVDVSKSDTNTADSVVFTNIDTVAYIGKTYLHMGANGVLSSNSADSTRVILNEDKASFNLSNFRVYNNAKTQSELLLNKDVYNIQDSDLVLDYPILDSNISRDKIFVFDGIDDYIEIPEDQAPQLAGSNFTIEFWLKQYTITTSGSSHRHHVIYNQGTGVGNEISIFMKKEWNTGNYIISCAFNGDNLNYELGNSFPYENNWHHYTFTFDSSSRVMKLYIDGVLKYSDTRTGQTTASGSVQIGTWSDKSEFMNGKLETLTVYNTIKSEQDIKDMYAYRSKPDELFKLDYDCVLHLGDDKKIYSYNSEYDNTSVFDNVTLTNNNIELNDDTNSINTLLTNISTNGNSLLQLYDANTQLYSQSGEITIESLMNIRSNVSDTIELKSLLTEDVNNTINIVSDKGSTETILIKNTKGTNNNAINIESSVGGLMVKSNKDVNLYNETENITFKTNHDSSVDEDHVSFSFNCNSTNYFNISKTGKIQITNVQDSGVDVNNVNVDTTTNADNTSLSISSDILFKKDLFASNSLIIEQDLVVKGQENIVYTDRYTVDDPLIVIGLNQTTSDVYDVEGGFLVRYKNTSDNDNEFAGLSFNKNTFNKFNLLNKIPDQDDNVEVPNFESSNWTNKDYHSDLHLRNLMCLSSAVSNTVLSTDGDSSNNITSGALQVKGGATIGKKLIVKDTSKVTAFNVAAGTDDQASLVVKGGITLGENIYFDHYKNSNKGKHIDFYNGNNNNTVFNIHATNNANGSSLPELNFVSMNTNNTNHVSLKVDASGDIDLDFTSDLTTYNITAGNFVIGNTYKIISINDGNTDSVNTDFTLIGASDNNVGTVFTATGVGTGTGIVSITHSNIYRFNRDTTDNKLIVSTNFTIDTNKILYLKTDTNYSEISYSLPSSEVLNWNTTWNNTNIPTNVKEQIIHFIQEMYDSFPNSDSSQIFRVYHPTQNVYLKAKRIANDDIEVKRLSTSSDTTDSSLVYKWKVEELHHYDLTTDNTELLTFEMSIFFSTDSTDQDNLINGTKLPLSGTESNITKINISSVFYGIDDTNKVQKQLKSFVEYYLSNKSVGSILRFAHNDGNNRYALKATKLKTGFNLVVEEVNENISNFSSYLYYNQEWSFDTTKLSTLSSNNKNSENNNLNNGNIRLDFNNNTNKTNFAQNNTDFFTIEHSGTNSTSSIVSNSNAILNSTNSIVINDNDTQILTINDNITLPSTTELNFDDNVHIKDSNISSTNDVEFISTNGLVNMKILKDSVNVDTLNFVNTIDAGSFVIGNTYEIKTVGTTDFTTIGASDNNIGTVFTATGVGSGTGTATEVCSVSVDNESSILYINNNPVLFDLSRENNFSSGSNYNTLFKSDKNLIVECFVNVKNTNTVELKYTNDLNTISFKYSTSEVSITMSNDGGTTTGNAINNSGSNPNIAHLCYILETDSLTAGTKYSLNNSHIYVNGEKITLTVSTNVDCTIYSGGILQIGNNSSIFYINDLKITNDPHLSTSSRIIPTNVSGISSEYNNLLFNGTSDKLVLDTDDSPDISDKDFTIEFYAKINNRESTPYIYTQGTGADTLSIYLDETQLTLSFGDTSASIPTSDTTDNLDNIQEWNNNIKEWNYYAIIYDYNEQKVTFNINGISYSPTTFTTTIGASGIVTIGYKNTDIFLDGELKELKVWNRIRNSDEINYARLQLYSDEYLKENTLLYIKQYNEYYKGTTSITPTTNASNRKDSDLISAYWTLNNLDNRITSIHNSVNNPLYIGNDNSVYDSEISVKSNSFNKMISSCIKFNDSNTNHITYINSVNFDSNFTIQFWYKHTANGTSNLLLESVSTTDIYKLEFDSTNILKITTANNYLSNTISNSTEWNFYSIVNDNTNNKLNIYVNGIHNKSNIIPSDETINLKNESINIGKVVGEMFNFTIHDIAKTLEQIQEDMLINEYNSNDTNLIVYLPMKTPQNIINNVINNESTSNNDTGSISHDYLSSITWLSETPPLPSGGVNTELYDGRNVTIKALNDLITLNETTISNMCYNSSLLWLNNNFTIEFWCRGLSDTNLLTLGTFIINLNFNIKLELGELGNTTIIDKVLNNNNSSTKFNDKWNHIAIVSEQGNINKVYINGTKYVSNIPINYNNNNTIIIDKLTELVMWKSIRTDDDIKASFNLGLKCTAVEYVDNNLSTYNNNDSLRVYGHYSKTIESYVSNKDVIMYLPLNEDDSTNIYVYSYQRYGLLKDINNYYNYAILNRPIDNVYNSKLTLNSNTEINNNENSIDCIVVKNDSILFNKGLTFNTDCSINKGSSSSELIINNNNKNINLGYNENYYASFDSGQTIELDSKLFNLEKEYQQEFNLDYTTTNKYQPNHHIKLDGDIGFTIEFWAKLKDSTSEYIILQQDNNYVKYKNKKLYFENNYLSGTDTPKSENYINIDEHINIWTHYAITYGTVGSGFTFYINGVSKSITNVDNTIATVISTSGAMTISDNVDSLKGDISDLLIFESELNLSNIQTSMKININSNIQTDLSSVFNKLLLYLPFYYNTRHELYINDTNSFVVNDYIKDETNNIVGQIKEIDVLDVNTDNRRCIVNIINKHNSFVINETIKSCSYDGTILSGVSKTAKIKKININTTMPISYYKVRDGISSIKQDSLTVYNISNMPYLYNKYNNDIIFKDDSNELNINLLDSDYKHIEVTNSVFKLNSDNNINIDVGNNKSNIVSSEYNLSINGDNSSHVIIKKISNSNVITTMSNHGIVNGTIAMIGEVPSYISLTGKNVEINTEYIVTDTDTDKLKLSKFDKRLINVISGTKLQVKDLDTVTNYNSLNTKVVYIHDKINNTIYSSTITSVINSNNKYDITLSDDLSKDGIYSTTHEFYIYILTDVVTLPEISDLGSNIKLHYYNDNSEGIQLNDKVLIKKSGNTETNYGSKDGGLEVDGGLLVKGKMVVSSTNKNQISLNSALYIREAMYFVPEIIDYDNSSHSDFIGSNNKVISSSKACTILNFKNQIQTISNNGNLQYELKNGLYNGQIKKIALHPNYETYSVNGEGISGAYPLEILINNLCDPDGQGIVDASLILNRGGQSMNLLWIENDNPFLNYPTDFTYNLENNTQQLLSNLTITTYSTNNEISFSGNLNNNSLFDNVFTLNNTTNITLTNNTIQKNNNDNMFNGSVYSSESYTNSCYLEFELLNVNNEAYYGLSKNPTEDNNTNNIDYAIYFSKTNSDIRIYEKGVMIHEYNDGISVNDIYEIIYNGSSVVYKRNNNIIHTTNNVPSNETFYFDSSISGPLNTNLVEILQFGPCDYKAVNISKYTIKKSSKTNFYYLTTKLNTTTYYLHYDSNDNYMLYDSTVSKAGNSGFSTTSAEFKFTHVASTNTLTSYDSNTSFGDNNQLSIYGQDNNDFAYVDNSVIASGNWILMDNNFTYM